jgi:C4-dicarboxylate transporter, DctM subunit
MSDVTIGLLGILAVLGLFLTGMELAYCMAIVGFIGFGAITSFKVATNMVAKDFFDVFSSYGLTVISLFVLMGQVAFKAGLAKNLYSAAYKFMGHIPGGLAMATVAGATAFKAICGSSPATAATFASVAVPEMDRYGYAKKLSTGIVATVGTLGILIPPSVILILYGVIVEVSIGRLFLAGIIPGLIVAFFFIVVIYGWCKINPAIGPRGARSNWGERVRSLPDLLWVMIIFVLVIGGLMKGFFTPTEAGSVGTVLVLILSLLKRDLGFKGFGQALLESLRTASMVLLLVAGSTVLGHFLAATEIPMITADWVVSLPFNRHLVMFFICLVYLIGGSFIDDLAFLVLATPIFYPAIAKLGFDPIWFGMVIAITVMIGVVIPPVAINVFVVKNITKVPYSVIYSGVYPFLISLVVAGALVFAFPQLSLWLPNLLMK